MTDWYVSSAAYAAIPAFVASTAYTVGQIIKPTAPAAARFWTFRCTIAGTSGTEPSWPNNNNDTVTSGGATFTNVTGQSAYFWSAAAGDHESLNGWTGAARINAGDRVFMSSDHSETYSSSFQYGPGGSISTGYGLVQFLSVNRAGSTPPVAADLTTGATITQTSGNFNFRHRVNAYYQGISFVNSGNGQVTFNDDSFTLNKTAYFKNCTFYTSNAASGNYYTSNCQRVIFDNTTLRFGHTGQFIGFGNAELIWLNTPSAIAGAVFPALLFSNLNSSPSNQNLGTLRGVDLSAITGTLVAANNNGANRYLFDSCRIAAGVTRYSSPSNTTDIIELINCFDGTNIINESYQPAGTVTTERTITLSGGATDDVGTFSHRLVSGTNIDKYANPLVDFWMDVENTAIGVSKTATVEIISSASLNNDDISLLLEYQGTAGSPVASFANTLPATVLTAPSAVASSTATWNASPATPVRQRLQATFTPRVAGRVRGQVRLGRPSTTVYVDPEITIN